MKKILTVFLFCFPLILFAQQTTIPHNHAYYYGFEAELNKPENDFHTSIRPFLESEVRAITNYDSLSRFGYNDKKFANSKIGRKFLKQYFFQTQGEDYFLELSPLFDLQYGKDFSNDSSLSANTRGVQVSGSIGKKFSFYSSFYENQAKFPDYISEYVKEKEVVPGQGRIKTFKGSSFDFSQAFGYISYTPTKHVNFQFGHGKNFIGDGYRSLLLSDFAYSYPFLKITTTVWKIRYMNLFTSFQSDISLVDNLASYPRKYGSFHYLDITIAKRIQLGLFEGIIWQGTDSTGKRGIDINYINPIIFYRPIEFSLNSADNAIMGINLKIKALKFTSVYGQFVMDDLNLSKSKEGKGFFQQKYGYQIGIKSFNLFGVKNLFVQAEYNQVRPYTYAHKKQLQNYAHYNEALAHPLGANFREAIGIIGYRWKDLSAELKVNYAVYGADTGMYSYGQNIFISDFNAVSGIYSFGNSIGQGVKTTLVYAQFRLSYLVNPKTNWNIFIEYTSRKQSTEFAERSNSLFNIGMRTSLRNLYYDF